MLGAIIGAAGSLAGGLLGAKKADKQMAMQKEFAQNAIQWRARDAEKAGISKYFAMGAPTTSYSPVSTGDYGLADAASKLGSGIEGQLGPQGTTTNKGVGINAEIAKAQLDGLRVDNDIKRAELASKLRLATQPGTGTMLGEPPIGPEGVEAQQKVSPADPVHTQRSFAISPELDLYRTHSGYSIAPPQNLAEVHENNAYIRWQWNIRNALLPFMYDEHRAPPYKAPAGSQWYFNPIRGEHMLYPYSAGRRPPRDITELYDRLRR